MKTETAAAPARMKHTRRLNQLIKLLWLVCGATYPLSGNLQGAITDGLVVYLNFDETLDGQAGTAVNGRLLTGTARYTKGVFGQAAQFRNSFDAQSPNDWAVALDGIEATYTNSFSVALWFRIGSTRQRLIGNNSWSDPSSRGWTIGASWLAGSLRFISQGQPESIQLFYDLFDGRLGPVLDDVGPGRAERAGGHDAARRIFQCDCQSRKLRRVEGRCHSSNHFALRTHRQRRNHIRLDTRRESREGDRAR
jgi:hypothetical protein